MRGFRLDGFLIALVCVVAAAILWPEPGAKGGFLHVEWITTYGVAVVFFLYGLTLAPEKMIRGMWHWKLHVVVQLGTFVLFPVIVLAAHAALAPVFPPEVWTGFFFIAAVPSTVSSSVAMTSLAGGNVPVAIFNATLSSLIGVFATPLLMAWLAAKTGISFPLGEVIGKVALLVLLPILVGQVAHRWFGPWAARNSRWLRLVDRFIILAIVYGSFSDSMIAGIWGAHDASLVVAMVFGAIALFAVVYGLILIPCRLLEFNREDTIACLFCASKKSLATGVPVATIMFAGNPALGLIIAPLMIYHFCQLVIVSVIANRYATANRAVPAV
ncbi:MAG TPA: bile acid:sodium symporter family protein [Bauldia sp.]|nr:bile acid:sodium symporter family protein [Bauldia sp.]